MMKIKEVTFRLEGSRFKVESVDTSRALWLLPVIALPVAVGEIGQEGSRRQIYVMNIQIGDSPMESSSTVGPPNTF